MNKEQRKKLFQMKLENFERNENYNKLHKIREANEMKTYQNDIDSIYEQKYNFVSKATKYNKWLNSIKESLVFDAIYNIYSESFGIIKAGAADKKYDSLKRALVESFIKEESDNIDGLINKMKYQSEMLSEIAVLIEKTISKIKESTNKDDESTYILDTSIKDDFFDKLNMIKPEDVIFTIRHRVGDAIEQFMTQNTADKIEISDIMNQAKERIDSSDNDTLKEAYNLEAKRKISDIYNRPKDLLSSMVYNLSEAAYKNEELGKRYLNSKGVLDMDAIVETCQVMYAFLETMNTIKLIHIDESVIKDVLNNMKR